MITRKQLDDAIWEFMGNAKNYLRHRPALIVLHPVTKYGLTAELFNDLSVYNENREGGRLLKYMGIKVYESEDVEKDKIELY